jgi:hypothetical protein
MKRLLIITAILTILSFNISAQDQGQERRTDEFRTLLGHERHNGVYGAFTIGYSEIENRQAVVLGGRFEWITGHSLGIGFGGTGFINENHFDQSLNSNVFLTGGYGGLYFEPILMPNYPVHLAFPVLLGAGGISYVTEDWDYNHNMIEDSEAFLIAEPGVEIELNLTRNFRLAAGATYRFTTPFDVGLTGEPMVSSSALRGFSYMLTFKFGRF